MSISARRNSLLKSSISIKSIGDTASSFFKGFRLARKNANEIVENTRESNKFKSTLIRQDNIFFRRRQENIRRKDREDELEASSVQGAPKTQGAILAKSSRGFLGRILNFIGILLIGWAIENLPKILNGIQSLIRNITKVGGILGFFVDGVKNILGGIGTLIGETISKITGFDFLAGKKEVEDGLESAQTNVLKAQNELAESANLFSDAENFGLPEPPGFDIPTETTVNAQKDETGTTDPLEKDQLETSEKEIDTSIEGISNNLSVGEGEEVVEEDNQDENTSEDNLIEGVATEVGQLNAKDPIGKDSGSSSSDTSAVSGEALQDPRDLLRKKQEESIKSKRRRRRGSSFLGTPDSVKNINQRVSSSKLDTDTYRGEVVASIEITDEMKAAALNPVKKDVNVQGQRKSKNTIVIVEKPVEIASSSASGMTSGAKSNIVTQGVNEEKMLLKMQSTSTLKYT